MYKFQDNEGNEYTTHIARENIERMFLNPTPCKNAEGVPTAIPMAEINWSTFEALPVPPLTPDENADH